MLGKCSLPFISIIVILRIDKGSFTGRKASKSHHKKCDPHDHTDTEQSCAYISSLISQFDNYHRTIFENLLQTTLFLQLI